jgi:hypothetical protein
MKVATFENAIRNIQIYLALLARLNILFLHNMLFFENRRNEETYSFAGANKVSVTHRESL